MYIITVLFSIKPEHITAFMQAIVSNARTSEAEEPGCKQFDVCVSASDSHDVFLYEVYDSKAAFDAHLASMHYRQFSEITAAWVNAKVIHVFERTHPHTAADV
jgi:autoinducer 2-degrading protein